jgi:hypothetical protein
MFPDNYKVFHESFEVFSRSYCKTFLNVKIFWSAVWGFVPLGFLSGGLCGGELFNGEVLLCKLQVRASVVSLSHQWTGHNRTCCCRLPEPVLAKIQ